MKTKNRLYLLAVGAAALALNISTSSGQVFSPADAVNNRAIAPNNDETLAALKPELTALFDAVYGAGNYTLEREQDARQRFSVYVKTKAPVSVAEALAKLG